MHKQMGNQLMGSEINGMNIVKRKKIFNASSLSKIVCAKKTNAFTITRFLTTGGIV